MRKAGQAIGGSPAALLSGSKRTGKELHLKEAGEAEGLNWVEATPKSRQRLRSAVRLGFPAAT